jgi:hypothetical protein
MSREEVFGRMRSVWHEYRAAAVAVTALGARAPADPGLLRREGIEPGTIAACLGNLEPTYVIRLYAEFEAALRDYWKAPGGMRRRTDPPAETLDQQRGGAPEHRRRHP